MHIVLKLFTQLRYGE